MHRLRETITSIILTVPSWLAGQVKLLSLHMRKRRVQAMPHSLPLLRTSKIQCPCMRSLETDVQKWHAFKAYRRGSSTLRTMSRASKLNDIYVVVGRGEEHLAFKCDDFLFLRTQMTTLFSSGLHSLSQRAGLIDNHHAKSKWASFECQTWRLSSLTFK
jgi:hypothetical protein